MTPVRVLAYVVPPMLAQRTGPNTINLQCCGCDDAWDITATLDEDPEMVSLTACDAFKEHVTCCPKGGIYVYAAASPEMMNEQRPHPGSDT